ncbi:MAG: lysophospholipid acyltransferase family protein [Deltaproteobacteria bacterium]|jgi:1-acyl-sn-glycerol-3-phosphate acyltransferase|nr:lysophospholipid acyltransferase family protein [Deltaproteobacteria bacterium]MBW2542934.1 lysophospholipid acyltransferase family protein [Deltaproteobacteria bacterium]
MTVRTLIARTFLGLTGWEAVGERIPDQKIVVAVAPHTSNWDLPYGLAIARLLNIRISWLAKHTLFWWPFGPLLRSLGGIPVRRDRPEEVVDQIVRAFDEAEALSLAITPEATRRHTTHWKSGFYRIAKTAGVPIQLGFIDYSRKRGGLGPAITPSGDVRADMDEIRAFFADKVGRYPEKKGEIRLHEEEL